MIRTVIIASMLFIATGVFPVFAKDAPAQNQFEAVGAPGAPPINLQQPQEYRLGPLDKISIYVYQMPDLSFPEVQIDANGVINLPQVGPLVVAGRTTGEVGHDIQEKLTQFLVNPQVIVSLREAVSQQVTVSGAVKAPNVYSLMGPTTLMQVIAKAGGPDADRANERAVLVLRTTDGQRTRAVFDLDAIDNGTAPDPEIIDGDSILVGTSAAKSALKAALSVTPFIGVFSLF